jgi:hypothetical protein
MTTTDDRDQYEDHDDDDGEAVAPAAGWLSRTAPLTRTVPHAPAYGPDGPLAGVRSEAVPDDEQPERHHVLHGDRAARAERMIWRNAFLGLYVFAILGYALWALARVGTAWNLSAFVVLMLGGLVPGLWFASRESNEREIEWQRAKPEARTATELPGLRRPMGGDYSPDYDR